MDSEYGSTDLPRYWVTLDKEVIFDYPKNFVTGEGTVRNLSGADKGYPYNTDITDITKLIREYIDTPKDELLTKVFHNDYWGLINILRAADKRIGVRRLPLLKKKTRNIAARKVIMARMGCKKGF